MHNVQNQSMELTISSKKAAEFLKVNESTIKRWADGGKLNCSKTSGGHRKFKITDILILSKQLNNETTGLLLTDKNENVKLKILNRDFELLCKELESLILNGNSKLTFDFLYSLYILGYSLEEIFDEIIGKTMVKIGIEWRRGKLSIENEHIATNTLISSLHNFEKEIIKKEFNGRTAVCAGFENEYHELGLFCVKINLISEGWKVIYPGINLPLKSMMKLTKKMKPDIICISGSLNSDKKIFNDQLAKLKKVSDKMGIKIITGGTLNTVLDSTVVNCNTVMKLNSYLKNNFQKL